MEGFHRFEWIDHYIVDPQPGVYLLADENDTVLEVGRSDYDVREAIRQASRSFSLTGHQVTQFWFECCSDAITAYFCHCWLWHRYGNRGEHPRPPHGINCTCPIPGCQPGPASVTDAGFRPVPAQDSAALRN